MMRSSGAGAPGGWRSTLGLLAIVLLAAGLRIYGLTTWDGDTHQHPDERFLTILASQLALPESVAAYFDTRHSSINPYASGNERYAYGQLPLTLTRGFAQLTGRTSFDSVNSVGRALSALADVGAVILTWLVARELFGVRQAHLAALLLAMSVLDVQLAHFFAVDTMAAAFSAGAIFFGHRAWRQNSFTYAALAGAATGLAMACKISSAMLLPVILLVFLWPVSRIWGLLHLVEAAILWGVTLLFASVAFRVAEPYAFTGPTVWNFQVNSQWLADKLYWAQVSTGGVDVPYMIQWTGTTPYLFWVQSLVRWGIGPALGLASLFGLIAATLRWLRGAQVERSALLLLLWALFNLAYFGAEFAKFMRYLLPIYFALAVFAAYALVGFADVMRSDGWLPHILARPTRSLRRALAMVPAAAVLVATLGWVVAFESIYGQPHSRIQASDWIYANVAPGSVIATEHWDDRLPLSVGGREGGIYRYVEMPLYELDTAAKRQTIVQNLAQADYVILASRRLEGSIPRLPERYPMTTEYYQLLNSGGLGFELAARFQVMPHLGPWTFDDSAAQEDFTVYDHPLVEVWKKQRDFAMATVQQRLGAISLDRVVNVKPSDSGKGALLLTPSEQQSVAAGGTWARLFARDSLSNRAPVPVWLVVAEALSLAAVPLLWASLRFLPDRGFGLSKILGLLAVALSAWLVASMKVLPFQGTTLLGILLILGVVSTVAVLPRRAQFARWIRSEWRLLLTTELVFLAGFTLFVWIRGINPDLWQVQYGGEKPMNFAYLNAVIKSDYFPPYDPWFSGGIINYYYFGFVMVATLVKLTGILPAVAFNLAEPTIYGAMLAGAFSVAFALSIPLRAKVRGAAPYVAGFLSALFVGILGNLDSGAELLDALARVGAAQTSAGTRALQIARGLFAVLAGTPLPPLDFWHPTRFIGPESVPPIHEFPFFTFLYGDLHAHALALPLTLAVVGLSLNLSRAVRAEPSRIPWQSALWQAIVLGALRATNTWDLPTFTGIALAAGVLGYAPWLLKRMRPMYVRLAVTLAIIAVGSQLAIWPFLQRYQLFYTGVDPIQARTALVQYLTINGLGLFCAGSLLAWYGCVGLRRMIAARAAVPSLATSGFSGAILPVGWLGNGQAASPAALVLLLGLLAFVAFGWMGYPTRAWIALFAAGAASATLSLWRRTDRAFHGGLLAIAVLLTLVPEFVALKGDIGRMNTVFKLYLQAWTLLAVASAVAIAWLLRQSRREGILRLARPAWLVVLLVLVGAGLSYPLFASESKLSQRFAALPWSLDGMAYLDVAHFSDRNQDLNLAADAQAIRWIQDHISGSPVILEGRSPVYRWGSRISIYTGLPTILGWEVHQSQQRAAYGSWIQERASDVQRLYDTPSLTEARSLMERYQVRYVYVGGLERAYYQAAGLAKFAQMPWLRRVYDEQNVQIYEVVP